MRRSLRIRADGVVAHTETFLVTDHPVCADSERGLFLFGAATPPHEEGITLARKSFPKKQELTSRPSFVPLCLCVSVFFHLIHSNAARNLLSRLRDALSLADTPSRSFM